MKQIKETAEKGSILIKDKQSKTKDRSKQSIQFVADEPPKGFTGKS